MAQIGTNALCGKKLKVAEMLVNPEYNGTITQMLEECDVPSRTFYHWLEDEEFVEAVNKLVDRYTNSELPRVWKALVRQCEKGDTQAIKLFFELKGKYKRQIDANVNVKSDELTEILKQLEGD